MGLELWKTANPISNKALALLAGTLITLTCLPSTLQANEIDPRMSSYKAEVDAVRFGAIDIKAKGELRFNLADDGDWDLTISIKGGPLKSYERSVGEHLNNQFRPLSFKRDVRFLFVKEKIQWQFDWPNQKVTGKVQKDDRSHALTDILHDPISFQVAMRQALMSGEQAYNTQFLRYSRPDDLSFRVVGEETIRIAGQSINTLVVEQTKPRRKDELKRIWVSPEHDYIALRFATYKEGKLAEDFYVTKLWINDKAVDFAS